MGTLGGQAFLGAVATLLSGHAAGPGWWRATQRATVRPMDGRQNNNRDYFLRTNRYEAPGLTAAPKPVFAGSDAHSITDLEQWLGKTVQSESQSKHTTWRGSRRVAWRLHLRARKASIRAATRRSSHRPRRLPAWGNADLISRPGGGRLDAAAAEPRPAWVRPRRCG
jgi:hypothetical protein